MGRNSEEDLKQTDLMRASREAVFEFLTDPDYTLWAEQQDKDTLQHRIETEANGHQAREHKIELTLESDCPIVLDRIKEAIEKNLKQSEKLTAFQSIFK